MTLSRPARDTSDRRRPGRRAAIALAMCLASGTGVVADRFDAWMGQTGEGWPASWGLREGRPVPVHYTMDPGADPKALRRAFESLPVLELTLDPDDLLGTERGIYSHPMESGEAWERKARIRWTGPGGPTEKGFETVCGVRIQGGWNRRPEESPKHSLRLVFRGRYGAPRLEYPLFGGGSGSFETLVLRGGNNNSWLHWSGEERRRADYLRDEWMRRSHAVMGHPAPRGRFVHLVLNGLYWGVFNLVERPDEHFAAERLGGRPKDWDSRNADKVLSGDDTAWRRLMAMAPAAEDPGVWAEIRGLLDVPAFIDYMVLNLYGANGDWDGASNWYAARRRVPAGGFRFFVWDGERTLESPEDSRIAEDAAESPSWIFQRLRKNAEFRRAFGLRARELLGPGGPLSAGAAAERFRALAAELETALPAEAARWGSYRATVQPYKTGPYEKYGVESHWKPEVRRLVERYFPQRGDVFARQLAEAGLLE